MSKLITDLMRQRAELEDEIARLGRTQVVVVPGKGAVANKPQYYVKHPSSFGRYEKLRGVFLDEEDANAFAALINERACEVDEPTIAVGVVIKPTSAARDEPKWSFE